MEVQIIKRGGDYPIDFTLLDDSGVAYDLTQVDKYYVYLYYNRFASKEVLAKYANDISGLSGYAQTVATDEANGKFQCLLETEETQSASIGYLYAEIKIQSTDAKYSNNTVVTVVSDLLIGKVEDAATKDDLNG